MESVIKETLRKWSITPLINRQSNTSFKIYDYDIPIGSEIQVFFNFILLFALKKMVFRFLHMLAGEWKNIFQTVKNLNQRDFITMKQK